MKLLPKSTSTILLMLAAASSTTTTAFAPQRNTFISHRRTATTTTTSTKLFEATFTSSSSPELERAKQVFKRFDLDDSGSISSIELTTILENLDLEASTEEADALFRYLDQDGDGEIGLEDFMPWYSQTVEAAKEVSANFQALLIGRRTVGNFDPTPVSNDVLRRAVACAIAAPNRSRSEPWRFISVGPETVEKFAELNLQQRDFSMTMETTDDDDAMVQPLPLTDWTKIPGWCVVTTKLTPGDPEVQLEDFKSTSCAVQNFMLSMWSEGIGTKWTSGPVQKTQAFADLCGVDTTKERVAGCIWYGFATGGLINADPKRRRKGIDDVLSKLL